jgi:methyltransferase (TIGR00027 family)
MADAPIKDVSDTAFMIAAFRALESQQPDSVVRDHMAVRLAGEEGKRIAAKIRARRMATWGVAIRTLIIDDLIRVAVEAGVDTVLNLGAGLDARPYRLELPHPVRFVEVDYPHMIELKEQRLDGAEPRHPVERVKLDLTDRGARRALLDRVASGAKAVLVLTEGVVPYLTNDDAGALADDLRARQAVRFWIVDYFSPRLLRYRRRSQMGRLMRNAPFQFHPEDWFGFFRQHGWVPREERYIPAEAKRLRRVLPVPRLLTVLVGLRLVLTTPARRAALRSMVGFVLLEPDA